MQIRYDEWLPVAAGLKGVVSAYWRVVGDGSHVPGSAILPDGHVELVFNFGDPVALSGPAYSGDQPDRCVVGFLTHGVQLRYRGFVNTFGVRFHPARGAPFFCRSAKSMKDRLLLLADVSRPLDIALSSLVAPDWDADAEHCRAEMDAVLLDRLASSSPVDLEIATVVDRLSGADPLPSIAEIAGELGMSSRQVQRRFLTSVGVPPKQFVRILRFSRLWQVASMQPEETWVDLAMEHGYADQAHMVREFRAFGVEPPTRVFTPDWYQTTELSRLSGPAEGVRAGKDVRSIQDPSRTKHVSFS